MPHQASPISVHFRTLHGTTYAVSRCDGAPVSDFFAVHRTRPDQGRDMQWARAFLDGVLRAPRVDGAKSGICIYPKGGR